MNRESARTLLGMPLCLIPSSLRALLIRSVALTAMLALLSPPTLAQVGLEGRTVPRQGYFLAFDSFNRGDYRDAMKGFRSAMNGGINTGRGRWIDSICYHTMIGECFYQMGDLPLALDQYEAALKLTVARRGWLGRLQLPPQVQPLPITRPVPWGPSERNLPPGTFPETMLSQQGTDINQVLRQGGTAAAPELYPVRVLEIMRCIGLSLRRRYELLGPVATQTSLTGELVQEFSRRQIPPNHWIQSLINVQLALAKSSAGQQEEALRLLQQSLAVGGRIDHPLTAIGLLHLAQLGLEAGNLELAQQSFFEATFPAVYYGQADVLAEALDGAARVHSMRGGAGIFPPLGNATTWCRANRLNAAAATALLASAENAANSGDTKLATRLLGQLRGVFGRSDLPRTDLGARQLYLNAMLAFQSEKTEAGQASLREAFTLGKLHSRRLLRLTVTTKLHASNELSALTAGLLYAELLREPTANDWATDTRDTLLFEMTPHVVELERWLDLAIERRESEQMLLISDMIRRHKFFSQLPLAGRMLAMRWMLAAPSKAVDVDPAQVEALKNRLPQWTESMKETEQAFVKLRGLPVVAEAKASPLATTARQIMQAADRQEQMLWGIALGPAATPRVFPPLRKQDEILAKLKPGQGVLVIIQRRQATHAIFLAAGDEYKQWQLTDPRTRKRMMSLMREIGNFDSKQVLVAERLLSDKWQEMAQAIFAPIAKELPTTALAALDELVIVPDGDYWYFPFEMVPVENGNNKQLLTDLVKIRYAPTAGLAVGDERPAQSGARVIVHGRLYNRETESITADAAERLKQQQPQSYVLRRRLPAASRYVAPSWRQLIVLDDIEDAQRNALDWSVAQFDRGKAGGSLLDWLELPWGGPELVVLPGFHTAAERGMRGKINGDEVLVATTALLATGTRTALLSRWRSGGQISMDLIREFCGGLADSTPAASLQRSMALARSTELDPSVEPRLKNVDVNTTPSAEHPFFWASYMLLGH